MTELIKGQINLPVLLLKFVNSTIQKPNFQINCEISLFIQILIHLFLIVVVIGCFMLFVKHPFL